MSFAEYIEKGDTCSLIHSFIHIPVAPSGA
jgi:hypothetical protein